VKTPASDRRPLESGGRPRRIANPLPEVVDIGVGLKGMTAIGRRGCHLGPEHGRCCRSVAQTVCLPDACATVVDIHESWRDGGTESGLRLFPRGKAPSSGQKTVVGTLPLWPVGGGVCEGFPVTRFPAAARPWSHGNVPTRLAWRWHQTLLWQTPTRLGSWSSTTIPSSGIRSRRSLSTSGTNAGSRLMVLVG